MLKLEKKYLSLFFLFFIFSIQISSCSAYSITRTANSEWYDTKWDNDWASTVFTAEGNRYRMKAWTYLTIWDGLAKMWWDTILSDPGAYFAPNEAGDATLTINWEFSGELYATGNGYLRFTYTMYYVSGGEEYPVPISNNGVKTYGDNSKSFADDPESHSFTVTNLSNMKIYYVKCYICLYNDNGATCDFYDGANGLSLVSINIHN